MKNVSACVIAKNEEQNLPTWLESMKGLADELIVVDTGSDDRTAEIAEAAGAKVFHYAWNKDFAAAKNYAMNQAHGKWLLILDADEYIRPEDYPAVKRAIRDYEHQADVIGFVTLLVNIDRDDHDRFLSDGVQIRLVRNLPQLRYHGNVHETLRYDGPGRGTKRMQFVRGITVWHTGYSSGIIRQKSQRNLAILLAHMEAAVGYIVSSRFEARIGADPLRGIAMRVHELASRIVERDDCFQVVGCGKSYFHGRFLPYSHSARPVLSL